MTAAVLLLSTIVVLYDVIDMQQFHLDICPLELFFRFF